MIQQIPKLTLISAALISLGLGTAPVVTDIAHAHETKVSQASAATPLLAQVERCRQVSSTVSGLNVRQAPSLSAPVVGVVAGGNEVALQDLGEGGWAPVTAPYEGYVSTSYLTNCAPNVGGTFVDATAVAATSDLCRQAIVRSGLNVRAEPTVYSNRVTALPTGTNVLIEGPANQTWSSITELVDGYVATRFLGECN
jgi:hypothetical protein